MRRTWLLFLSILLPAGCQQASQMSDPVADEATIRAVQQGMESTWDTVDLEANAEYVDSDMGSLPPWCSGDSEHLLHGCS
jgi:hypothetical protein